MAIWSLHDARINSRSASCLAVIFSLSASMCRAKSLIWAFFCKRPSVSDRRASMVRSCSIILVSRPSSTEPSAGGTTGCTAALGAASAALGGGAGDPGGLGRPPGGAKLFLRGGAGLPGGLGDGLPGRAREDERLRGTLGAAGTGGASGGAGSVNSVARPNADPLGPLERDRGRPSTLPPGADGGGAGGTAPMGPNSKLFSVSGLASLASSPAGAPTSGRPSATRRSAGEPNSAKSSSSSSRIPPESIPREPAGSGGAGGSTAIEAPAAPASASAAGSTSPAATSPAPSVSELPTGGVGGPASPPTSVPLSASSASLGSLGPAASSSGSSTGATTSFSFGPSSSSVKYEPSSSDEYRSANSSSIPSSLAFPTFESLLARVSTAAAAARALLTASSPAPPGVASMYPFREGEAASASAGSGLKWGSNSCLLSTLSCVSGAARSSARARGRRGPAPARSSALSFEWAGSLAGGAGTATASSSSSSSRSPSNPSPSSSSSRLVNPEMSLTDMIDSTSSASSSAAGLRSSGAAGSAAMDGTRFAASSWFLVEYALSTGGVFHSEPCMLVVFDTIADPAGRLVVLLAALAPQSVDAESPIVLLLPSSSPTLSREKASICRSRNATVLPFPYVMGNCPPSLVGPTKSAMSTAQVPRNSSLPRPAASTSVKVNSFDS